MIQNESRVPPDALGAKPRPVPVAGEDEQASVLQGFRHHFLGFANEKLGLALAAQPILRLIEEALGELGVDVTLSNHFGRGGAGAQDLARATMAALENPSTTTFCYPDDLSLEDKAQAVVRRVYGADGVTFTPGARRELARLEGLGYGGLPVCIAKTQYSFSTDPKVLGAPSGFEVPIREVRLSAGAGFVVLISGSIMTMPGLPKRPSACDIDVAPDGTIAGMR